MLSEVDLKMFEIFARIAVIIVIQYAYLLEALHYFSEGS